MDQGLRQWSVTFVTVTEGWKGRVGLPRDLQTVERLDVCNQSPTADPRRLGVSTTVPTRPESPRTPWGWDDGCHPPLRPEHWEVTGADYVDTSPTRGPRGCGGKYTK